MRYLRVSPLVYFPHLEVYSDSYSGLNIMLRSSTSVSSDGRKLAQSKKRKSLLLHRWRTILTGVQGQEEGRPLCAVLLTLERRGERREGAACSGELGEFNRVVENGGECWDHG